MSRPRPPPSPTPASALALVLALASCASPLSRAEALFRDGRYIEAKYALARLDTASATWDLPRRARYALYSGLTLGALGDAGRAGAWLAAAKALEDAHPGALSPADARRLEIVLESGP